MGIVTDQKQFFRDLYASIEENCTDQQLQLFGALDSDAERFRFVHDLQGIDKFGALSRQATGTAGKSSADALELKRQGNEAFQAQHYEEAVRLYGRSQLLTPPAENGGSDVSIVLANRSAALYHLKLYDQALDDIELALPAYPKRLLYKLTERKARCLLAKNELVASLQWFKETVSALDLSDVPLDRRQKLEKDSQIMIKLLPPQIAALQKNPPPLTTAQLLQQRRVQRDPLHSELSTGVEFDRTETEGRFAVARNDIIIGEKILVEHPHCAVLLESFAQTHCQHCFKRTTVPLACPRCADVVFCSTACRRLALETYHRYECGMLRILWNSGTSVTCHMAYRVVAQQSVSYFRQLHAELVASDADRSTFERNALRLPVADYRRVYHLVRHEHVRGAKGFLNYAAMAYFLTHCLRMAEFFPADQADDFDFVGALVLRTLQIVQFNSHEVYELQKDGARTVFLGGGLYPTLALFNHSCNPGIVRYYKGTAVFVHAIANIRVGSQIAENYGPLFSQNPIEDRQRLLKSQYWFDCRCEPCTSHWPVFNRMRSDELRFKCDSERPCDNVLVIPVDTDAFMVKCDRCGQFTNILKGLKAVQDTDVVGQAAKRHEKAGEWRLAILKYIEMVNIMDGVMAPPFSDYCKAQQSIKDCLLQFGNKEI